MPRCGRHWRARSGSGTGRRRLSPNGAGARSRARGHSLGAKPDRQAWSGSPRGSRLIETPGQGGSPNAQSPRGGFLGGFGVIGRVGPNDADCGGNRGRGCRGPWGSRRLHFPGSMKGSVVRTCWKVSPGCADWACLGSAAPGRVGLRPRKRPAGGQGDRRNIGSGGCGRQGCRASGSLVSPGPGFSRAASCERGSVLKPDRWGRRPARGRVSGDPEPEGGQAFASLSLIARISAAPRNCRW
jgi:hypothetical protein